jgi:DNA-binding NarL/FixJ family response regulator
MDDGIAKGALRILIADDSEGLRDRLGQMVSQVASVGTVHLARDVAGTLAALRDEVLDLLILDIQMPGGSGLDVLRAAKQHSPAPIVIMLTNYPYAQYREKCLELGADHFFSKSTNSNELLALIERLARPKGGANE